MIIIKNKRCKSENILKEYPDAVICDVTSQAKDRLVKLSPFYPHGGIPVPFSEGVTAMCVEGIWQGLKVFEEVDVLGKRGEALFAIESWGRNRVCHHFLGLLSGSVRQKGWPRLCALTILLYLRIRFFFN